MPTLVLERLGIQLRDVELLALIDVCVVFAQEVVDKFASFPCLALSNVLPCVNDGFVRRKSD